MEEDPAVSKAKQLVREKQTKQAFQVLIQCIAEQNAVIAHLQGQPPSLVNVKEKNKPDGFWVRMKRACAGTVLFVIILVFVIMMLSNGEDGSDKEYKAGDFIDLVFLSGPAKLRTPVVNGPQIP